MNPRRSALYVVTAALIHLGTCPGHAAETSVMTSFALLVGFPASDADPSSGAVLVPGTVIPVDGNSGSVSADQERQLVERSVAFSQAAEKLWSTFRLDPQRMLQKGSYQQAELDRTLDLPTPDGSDLDLQATLVAFDDHAATYRVVFRQEGSVLADSKVAVNRGGRAVVGGVGGDAAPYIFLFVEPDPSGLAPAVRFEYDIGLTEPTAVEKTMPVYPEEARARGLSGIVVLLTRINVQGEVVDTKTLRSPDPLLTHAAVESVRAWTFNPSRREDGTPVDVLYVLTIKFKLE